MLIKNYNDLPKEMQTPIVKNYYDLLSKKTKTLAIKRLIDIVLCGIITIIASPFLLIFALLIKLTSKGPVIFKQQRVGKNMKIFNIYKFRTMEKDASKKGPEITTNNDNRITSFGKFLRKINMDEMPQLFNVLKGDMSIIGTRPEVLSYVNEYSDEMFATLLLPPGMLSLASVFYKDENSMLKDVSDVHKTYVEKILPDKMKYNLEYLKIVSIKEDFKLIGKSIACMFK
ncbi:MAG: sugar transferase [Oscillospiraceae bacterium]